MMTDEIEKAEPEKKRKGGVVQGQQIKPPHERRIQKMLNISKDRKKFIAQLAAEKLGLPIEEIPDDVIGDLGASLFYQWLDQRRAEAEAGQETPAQQQSAEHEALAQMQAYLREAIAAAPAWFLEQKSCLALRLRYGLDEGTEPLTLRGVGEALGGKTSEWARQLVVRGLAYLKDPASFPNAE